MFKKIVGMAIVVLLGLLGTQAIAKVKIKLLITPESVSTIYPNVKKAFEKACPDIDLNIEVVPASKYADTLLLRAAIGDLPDLFLVHPGPEYDKYYQSNLLMPMDNLLKEFNVDVSKYPQNLIELQRRNGKIYAFPFDTSARGIFVYNKKLLKEAGLPEPTENMTWQEFTDMARKLTLRDEKGNVIRYGLLNKFPHVDFLYQFGGRYVDNQFHPKKALFAHKEALRGIQEFLNLVKEGTCMPLPKFKASGGSQIKLFNSQKVAMVITGLHKNRGIINAKFDWDWQVVPEPNNAKSSCALGSISIAINGKSKHPKEAMKFILWAVKEGNFTIIRNKAYGVITSIPWCPDAKENFDRFVKSGKAGKKFNWQCVTKTIPRAIPWHSFPGSAEFDPLVMTDLWDVFYGRKDISILKHTEQEAQKLLDRF